MSNLLERIAACRLCAYYLPNEPRPVVQFGPKSRILIIGQAPGRKVHETGIPWDDASGDELRRWLGVDKDQFYNADQFALVPMGFCYPGNGKSGDLPPRPECAPAWHELILSEIRKSVLVLLIGQYSQKYYLRDRCKDNLTETVKAFREYLPRHFPLVHPSPRNRIWQKKNPWFHSNVVPCLQNLAREALS